MTQEQKAKAYDEALERARRLNVDNMLSNESIEEIFHELKESEDERIRKELVAVLEDLILPDDQRRRFLDYLEKQKEQKPVECIKFDNEFENQVSHLLASVLNSEYEYNAGFVKHAAQSLLGYAKNEIRSGELDKIERLMKALKATNAQIGELVEENYKLKEQKSDNYSEERKLNHEWTSEDWSMLCDIRRYIEGTGSSSGITNQERAAWLCELPKRFSLEGKEQKPAEWSDEDAYMLNCCISSIEEAKENRYAYKETDGDTSYDREIDWLNSLRPQPHTVSIKNATKFGNLEYERGVKDGIQSEKSRQWKPSEEQMDALRASNSYWKGTTNEVPRTDLLESLYNDLEKLIAKR